MAVYNAISLPMQIAFVSVQNSYDESSGLQGLETSVDILFAIDIIINFMSAYIDTTDGETIT